MIQEMFRPRVTEAAAAGFVGLLSLFNLGGRFLWSSLSDIIGRKNTYATYFLLGGCLYAAVPTTGHLGSVALFVASFAIIMSMYGGGFRHHPGVSARPVRHDAGRRDSRTAADGLVGGGYLWPDAHLPVARNPEKPGRAAGRGIYHDDVPSRGAAGHRSDL
jgi:MFS family permease